MGKQVNFYMTATDEQEFVSFVRSDRRVGIFKYAVPSIDPPLLDELPKEGEPYWYALWLWDRDHSPPPRLRYVERQHHYVVEDSESEVIEFQRCGIRDGRLVRGRIWAEMNSRTNSNSKPLSKKSEAFCKWFDRLGNWIKRRGKRNAVGDYILPDAAAFSTEQGALVQEVFVGGHAIAELPTSEDLRHLQ
jgi:hypothetical protein